MPKYVADEKKKKKEQETAQKKAQSPSVSKVNERAKNSTFLGGGSAVKKAEQSTYKTRRLSSEKKTTTTTKRTTMTDAQYQKTYGEPRRATAQRNQTVKPEPVKRTTNHRLTAAQTQKMYGTTNPKLQTAEESRREREERRKEREAQRKEREERRLAAQRQKSGLNDQPTAAQKAATDRALKNTLPIAKESAKGAAYGHLTTLNDIASIKSQGNGKSREEIYDPNLAEKSRQQAEERVKKYQAKTQETEDAIQKLTKNAKGLEKAYYGAVESGTGMLTDMALGMGTQGGSLAAMFSRTYGSTRGKAQQEGATQAEDRAYAAAQAAKEVGTELIFPGAGLARGYAGKQGLKLADTAANILTKNLRGRAADLGGAGVRLLGGVLEENAEEVAGWGLDPLIKELTYGKKTRTRNAQQAMKERSNALRAEIQNEDDARAAAAYLSSDDFFEQTVNAYREAGLSKKDAEEVADRMRDYLTASLTGDTDSMEQIEDEVSKKVAGSKKLEWDFDELKDTIASTTLLTAATGLPGTGMTAVKGAVLRDQLGDDGVRALANTAIDFEDGEMSLKAKAMKARLDSGNELTSTQVYDLQVGMQEQIRKDTQREESSRRMADKRIKSDNLLTPYRQNENGGIDLDEATEAAYREHVSKAKDIIDGLTSETKESLTANEKVDGSKAIAGFQTGVFTIEDANTLNYSNTTVRAAFEEATGVDLGQYVVKNKDGSVNIPATNTKTKDALFAMAADNLVKSAQAETENWMDNTKGQVVTQVSARMGASGSAVLQQALDDVDERDRSKYMMTANATDMLYQAARNMGTEWESIAPEATRMFPGISESKLKMMYEAGLADREMANDKARGRQVRMGQALSEMGEQETATGKVFIDTEVPLKGSVIRTFTEVSRNLGADIHFVDYIYDAENNPIEGANGSYDPNTNTFYLNVATGAETNIGYIFMHETTHYLKTYAPEQYQALENLVRERWFAYNPSQMQDAIARKIEAYKRATKGQQVLTEEQALEEIIADASHDFINDPEFARQVAEEDMGLAKAVLDSIRNALRMLRRIFASGSIDDDTHMNSLFRELDIMAEAEKLWLDAYKVAVQNSSINAVNEWQDNVNEASSTRGTVLYDEANIDELDMTNKTVEDSDGNPIAQFQDNGDVSFSISSYEDKGRDTYIKYLNKMVKSKELSQEEADDMLRELDTIYNISKRYADSGIYAPFSAWSSANVVYNEKGKPVFSAIKKNSEYKMNIDFSTICKKRRTLDAVFREMINRGMFEKLDLNKDESAAMVVNINNLIRQHKFEAACALCFVEARRYRQQQTATTFTNMWNELVESMYEDKSKIAYFNFGEDSTVEDVPDGIHTMDAKALDLSYIKSVANATNENGKKLQTAEAKAARLILKDPSQRKLMRVGDMMASTGFENMQIQNPKLMKIYNAKKGTGGAKSSFGDVQYLNEIIRSKTFDRRKAYAVSGVRIQSFSDYVPRMVFDYVQVIADLAAKKLPAHAYTKEKLFAYQFGLTGAKINLSLVPDVVKGGVAPGLDAKGNYVWNKEGTFPYEEAMALQKAEGYKDNCGTIAVGISDEQIRKMLADPTIQMVIPYHKSSLNPIVAAMTNVDRFKDYTDFQNTKDADGKTVSKDFDWDNKLFELTHDKEGKQLPKEQWGNVQDLVKEYADWCKERNYTPKFSDFLYMEDGSINPGYYKLLEDFALLDNDGNFKPQGDVQMRFPTENDAFGSMAKLIGQGLSADTRLEAKREREIGSIVDEIDEMFNAGTLTEQSAASEKLALRLSITPEMDEEYNEAIRHPIDWDRAQELVDDAAKLAGYTPVKMFHGSLSEEFTAFRNPSDNIRAKYGDYEKRSGFIYVTTDEDYALNYSSYGEPFSEDYEEGFILEGYINVQNTLDLGDSVDRYAFETQNDSLLDPEEQDKRANKGLRDVASAVNMTPSELLKYLDEDPRMVGDVWTIVNSQKFAELVKEMGYDSIHTIEYGANCYGLLDPTQIKSSDAITYDEDGSPISLSERFDPTNDDIRYSLPTEDSVGKILSNGQMEYFKNSQARDRDGNLAVVYHSTRNGGFTIFDPSYSDDRRSIFFTDSYDMSQSYSGGGKEFNAMTFGLPEVGTLTTLSDVLRYFDKLSQAQEDMIDIYLYDADAENTYEYRPQSWSNNKSLSDFIDEYGDAPENGVQGEFVDGETGEIIGEFNTINDMFAELKECVNYLNESSGGTNGREEIGTYACYLNLEDPLILECNGANWNSILDPYFKPVRISYDGESYYKDNTTIPWTLDELREDYGDLFVETLQNEDAYDLDGMGKLYYVGEDQGEVLDPEVDGMPLEGNTRFWCEEAEAMGHDGVIFRDLQDYGTYSRGYGSGGDVYVAFRSNQVKDINNENPSENPDIRYSFVDEDESLSRIAYEDAMSDSYDVLQEYETSVIYGSESEFFKGKAYAANMDEEAISAFYDALKAEDAVPSADPAFEEDRVRRARSKEDFYNNIYAKWNDRWTTEGEVLDITSVKKNIKNLVMGVMANSNTDARYRNDIVKQTLLDVRTAYQLMKQDRSDVASYLLYHSAQRMIDGVEFIRDDTAFKEYKEIRDFLRGYRINAPEEYWQNVEFNDFRKEYYGRLRIGKGNNNIESVYQDLADRWPHLFNESEREKAGLGDAVEDLLQHIGVVVDSNVTPFMEAYSSEEAVALISETADALYDIMVGGKELVSLADSYKNRFDEKTKAMKQRHAEAILRERKIREEGIRKEREKFRVYRETRKEKALHTKYFEGIKNKYDELTKRLLTNTKEKHIPEQYKRELAELLKAFEFQTVGSKKREARTGYKAQKTIKLEAMRTALERIEANSQMFHINDSVTEIMDDLLGINEASMNRQSIEGKTLDELSASELEKINKLLGALLHEFNNYEKVKVGIKKQQAADIGHSQNNISLEHADAVGEGKDYQDPFLQSIDRIINLDMMTPAFLFRKIDPNNEGLGLMWKEIRKSFDKYVRNTNQLNEWIEDIVGEYHDKGILWNKYGSGELSKWRSINYAQTFKLTYGTLELTPAQMMSVACLANRKQAYDHMVGAGVVVSPVSFQAKIMSDVKKKINKSLSLKLTDEDIKTIVTALTPEQRQVANKLQELMATKMAAWGNEASVNVIGIKLFEDPDYFPIRSDKAGLTKDLDPNQFEQAIRNFGFAKAVQPGARNAIMIDDIFDVVTEHCNNMNLYNAYTESMNDFMKVYNYREVREEGEYTVEQALRHAYSDKAPMFIMQFMRDLNGNVSGRASGIESMYNALLANAKKASVFANFRVAAQQPTALSRAFYVIDEKYIKGIKVEKDAMVEMFEHCPIALWKSWGYYDINMGKSIEDVIMNNGRWLEDKATDLYGALDNVTWTAIWQMVKAETKDLYPELKEGTDEFFEHCNERMSEVVDLTQVVDSPMHRSHAMRDKGFFKKMTTAFMAEPTLTLNMLRDGVTRTREAYKRGKAKLASQILTRTIGVYLLQSVMVAAAQSIVDALRGKNPNGDDDDNDGLLHLWWVNFIENWKEELNPLGKIYVIKDIKSMMDGWENRNLALQGVYYLSLGYRQLTGDPYARSSKSWYENMLYGMGYLTGVPVKTMMTGISNTKKMLGIQTPILDEYAEFLDSIADKKDDSEASIFGGSIGELLRKSMDATADMMGYKPIEGGTKSEKKPDKKKEKTADDEREAKLQEYRESLSDNYTEEQKNKLVKQYEKTLDAETASESAGTLTGDELHDHIREGLDNAKFEMEKRSLKAAENAAGLTGNARNNALWDVISEGYTKSVDSGNMATIQSMRDAFEANGGDVEWFDAKITDKMKSAYKKTIGEGGNALRQEMMHNYLTSHGVSDSEISEIVRKTYTARDLKAALRIGNEEYIMDELVPLVAAGLTREDFEYLYKYRNYGAKDYDGKYTDPKYTKTTGTFVWPTDGQITSYFGYRNAPTAGASSNHPAIDIGAPMGSQVVASDGGVVITAGWNGGYGNSVGIKHANGMVTYYNHLSAWNVKVGDQVAQGQPIANVGSTGISTGPHLDFKILDADGEPVDPLKYLSSRS